MRTSAHIKTKSEYPEKQNAETVSPEMNYASIMAEKKGVSMFLLHLRMIESFTYINYQK